MEEELLYLASRSQIKTTKMYRSTYMLSVLSFEYASESVSLESVKFYGFCSNQAGDELDVVCTCVQLGLPLQRGLLIRRIQHDTWFPNSTLENVPTESGIPLIVLH